MHLTPWMKGLLESNGCSASQEASHTPFMELSKVCYLVYKSLPLEDLNPNNLNSVYM